MAHKVCPVWLGYLLANPLRKLAESPSKILGPHIQEGMTVLEPGSAMGFFTLPMARMAGPRGKVVALDVQQGMLDKLERRAARAGLGGRIEARLCPNGGLGVEDLAGEVDFAAALHVVHEVPETGRFFREIHQALRPGGRLLVMEPKGHVSEREFADMDRLARQAGFEPAEEMDLARRRVVYVRA